MCVGDRVAAGPRDSLKNSGGAAVDRPARRRRPTVSDASTRRWRAPHHHAARRHHYDQERHSSSSSPAADRLQRGDRVGHTASRAPPTADRLQRGDQVGHTAARPAGRTTGSSAARRRDRLPAPCSILALPSGTSASGPRGRVRFVASNRVRLARRGLPPGWRQVRNRRRCQQAARRGRPPTTKKVFRRRLEPAQRHARPRQPHDDEGRGRRQSSPATESYQGGPSVCQTATGTPRTTTVSTSLRRKENPSPPASSLALVSATPLRDSTAPQRPAARRPAKLARRRPAKPARRRLPPAWRRIAPPTPLPAGSTTIGNANKSQESSPPVQQSGTPS